MKSISPLSSALTEVCASAIQIHSTRSTLAMLAAGEARGRLGARLVLGVLEVDGLLAGLPLVLLEHEGAGADGLGDLRVGAGLRDPLGHHEGDVGGGLAERAQHQAVGLPKLHDEGLGVRRLQLGDEAHELLAHAVARAPALQRDNAVLGRHGLAVVPFEPIAQREGPGELVVADRPFVDHLRLDLKVAVERKQRVVDHHAVVRADQRRGPDRIDDLEIRVQRHLERRLGEGRWRQGQACRQGGDAERTRALEAHAQGTHGTLRL